MKRKTEPQREFERLSLREYSSPEWMPYMTITRLQFNRVWQIAYRRGMERAAGVAIDANERWGTKLGDGDSPSAAWHKGRNAAAERIRSFIALGAKDE